MKFYENLLILLFCSFTFVCSWTEDPVKDFKAPIHRKCNHEKKTQDKYYLSGKYDRKLANTYYNEVKFENMRIHFDYSFTLPHEEKIIKELVMPPVKRFYENSLSVRRFPGKIRFPKSVRNCQSIPVPEHLYKEGVETDLVIIVSTYRGMKKYYYEHISGNEDITWDEFNNSKVKSKPNSDNQDNRSMNDYLTKYFTKGKIGVTDEGNTSKIPPWEINDGPSDIVGWSFMCMQDVYTLRPLAGVMQYVADINPTPRAIEEAVWTTLHEIMHILAMDMDLYSDFIDSEFNKMGFDKTLKMTTRLKDLDKIMEERKDHMDDLEAFLNFESPKLKNNSQNITNSSNISINSTLKDLNTNATLLNSKKRNSDKTNNNFLRKNRFKQNLVNNTIAATVQNPNNNINTSNIIIQDTIVNINENPSVANKTEIISNSLNTTNQINKTNSSLIDSPAPIEEEKELQKIKLDLVEQFYEIKVPKNLNLTLLYLAIDGFIDNSKLFIKTPKVIETGIKHFGCQSLDGVELEHFGGLGSSFSHWSKRILNTEFMIADSYGENFISNFTLALLEDSGWYKVDYSKSENIPWGKEKGCEFLQEKCIMKKKKKNTFFALSLSSSNENGNKNEENLVPSSMANVYDTNFKEEFCTGYDEEKCSISHVFRAICGISKYGTTLPKEYQYFENPKVGGWINFGDFCPYPIEWFDPNSGTPIGSCRNGIQLRKDIGEKICDNCRCFHSSLVEEKLYKKNQQIIKKDPSTANHKLEETRAACYEARCRVNKNGKTELVIVIDDIEIKCPKGGAILSVDGFKGFIECPKVESVCTGALDPRSDYTTTSAYNLFSHLSDQLLNILYDFVKDVFKNKNKK